jgi:anti-sigma factor RsiW
MNEGNMKCPINGKESAEILLDYCAQTLEPSRAAELEKHIETCGDCKTLVAAQREVWETLDRWTPVEVSPTFDARLYARIAQYDATPPWKQWMARVFQPAVPVARWKPMVSLSAACAVLVMGLLVNMPDLTTPHQQVRTEKVDIEQVEQTLDDLDILIPPTPAS